MQDVREDGRSIHSVSSGNGSATTSRSAQPPTTDSVKSLAVYWWAGIFSIHFVLLVLANWESLCWGWRQLTWQRIKATPIKLWKDNIKWRMHPRYPNGTLITGRLTDSEVEEASRSLPAHTSPLPPLPPEIIREIVRHATDTFPAPATIHIPTSFNYPLLSASSSFPYSHCSHLLDEQVHRKLHDFSMRTKRSISQVSKVWRDVAVEFLFNSVRLRSHQHVQLVWRALELDAKRRGEELNREGIATPGSAAWWVREIWLDLDLFKETPSRGQSGLSMLVRLCPNVVSYRGFGGWKDWDRSSLETTSMLRHVLGVPDKGLGLGDESDQDQEYDDEVDQDHEHDEILDLDAEREIGASVTAYDAPDTGRRIALHLAHAFDPFATLFTHQSSFQFSPHTLSLPCLRFLELCDFWGHDFSWAADHPIQTHLPNVTDLCVRGTDALAYAKEKLILPSLQRFTYGKGSLWPFNSSVELELDGFFEAHGLGLQELTILDKLWDRRYLERLGRLCPTLQTFRSHYLTIPRTKVPNVTTVGLYGLEDIAVDHQFGRGLGELLTAEILDAFPDITTIQDMSWRSAVIRRRGYTKWKDPDAIEHRIFWSSFAFAAETGLDFLVSTTGERRYATENVSLLDWKGRAISCHPQAEASVNIQCPDDELLEVLLSGGRL